jgi:flagellar motor component MotA
MSFLIGLIIAAISLPISFALGASAGVAWTIALLIVLVVGCGALVITDDINWFD